MNDQVRQLLEELAEGKIPDQVPDGCKYADELSRVVAYLATLQQFTLALCRGDLSREMGRVRGPLAGSLKGLQANLRHVAWQTKRIASGDFSQRVESMGDFSIAFNAMVKQLDTMRSELIHLSTHDALTGLYNRIFFDAEFTRIERGRSFPVSFIIADINGLKEANDLHGHAHGDRLIVQTAKLLGKAMRADDILARLGGDEFAVIMPRADAATAETVIARLRSSQAEQDAAETPVSFSLGAGTAPDAKSLSEAFKEADNRMYLDKADWKQRSFSSPPAGPR
jgi:diguanylate cyclase (GGDEF)-like protein